MHAATALSTCEASRWEQWRAISEQVEPARDLSCLHPFPVKLTGTKMEGGNASSLQNMNFFAAFKL